MSPIQNKIILFYTNSIIKFEVFLSRMVSCVPHKEDTCLGLLCGPELKIEPLTSGPTLNDK